MTVPSGNKILKPHEVVMAILIVGLSFGLIVYFAGNWELSKDGFLGEPAPEIEYQGGSGKQAALSEQKGSVVLINFWASWCAPCMEEMPSLRMLEEHLKNRGFVLLAFNIGESTRDVRDNMIPGLKLPENLVFNFSKEQLKPYSIDAIPVSVLINKKGKVVRVFRGPRNWMSISALEEIEKLLKE